MPSPPPSAISGASGPSTTPRPIVASAASITPGSSIGCVDAGRSGPPAGTWPPLPGSRTIANAVDEPGEREDRQRPPDRRAVVVAELAREVVEDALPGSGGCSSRKPHDGERDDDADDRRDGEQREQHRRPRAEARGSGGVSHRPSRAVPHLTSSTESSASAARLDELADHRRAAGPRHRVLERTRPDVLDEDDGHRLARPELRAQVVHRRRVRAGERAPVARRRSPGRDGSRSAGRRSARRRRRARPPPPARRSRRRCERTARRGSRSAPPLSIRSQRADQPALELGVRAEAVDQQLCGGAAGARGGRPDRPR